MEGVKGTGLAGRWRRMCRRSLGSLRCTIAIWIGEEVGVGSPKYAAVQLRPVGAVTDGGATGVRKPDCVAVQRWRFVGSRCALR